MPVAVVCYDEDGYSACATVGAIIARAMSLAGWELHPESPELLSGSTLPFGICNYNYTSDHGMCASCMPNKVRYRTDMASQNAQRFYERVMGWPQQ